MVDRDESSERYGYSIHTEAIRPMGKTTHVAKVTRMVDRKLGVDVPFPGEAWGESAADALSKMKELVEKWIAAQA